MVEIRIKPNWMRSAQSRASAYRPSRARADLSISQLVDPRPGHDAGVSQIRVGVAKPLEAIGSYGDRRHRCVLGQSPTNVDQDWRDRLQIATLDPFRRYAGALGDALPDAVQVLDCFHATKLAVDAVDLVRRRVQNDTLGHRGRKGDPLYGIRRVLRKGAERLTVKQYQRLVAALATGDPTGQLARAWIVMQELRYVYGAIDITQARHRLHRFYTLAADAGIPEITRLARAVEGWQPQLLAYFTTGGASNGPTEAVNLLIKRIKRVGFGFRNFANYRLRLLLHCGVSWHTSLTPRMRTRTPRLAA